MITSTWGLLALLAGGSSLAIVLANKTKLGAKLGYVLCAQFIGIILVNLNVVPASPSIGSIITDYFVPFAVVLLLFFSDIRQILKVGPKLLLTFVAVCILTSLICIVCAKVFYIGTLESSQLYGMLTADYVGNMQTLALMASNLNIPDELVVAISAAQTIAFALYSILTFKILDFKFMKKNFRSYRDSASDISLTEKYDKYSDDESAKVIPVQPNEIAILFGCAIVTIWLGNVLAGITGIYAMLFYVIIAVILANFTPISKYKINDTIGTWMFNIYMVYLGTCAKFSVLAGIDPKIIIGTMVVTFGSLALILLFVKILRWPAEYAVLSSMAGIGGPISTPPLAKGYGWEELVMPGLLLGILGNVVGSYFGVGVFNILQSIL
jgi:uncharacterized membrane protein